MLLLQLPETGVLLERLRGGYYDGEGDLDEKIAEKLEGVACRLGGVGGVVDKWGRTMRLSLSRQAQKGGYRSYQRSAHRPPLL